MTERTPAEQLDALPDPVQAELWAMTRHVIGMTEEEHETALHVLVGVCQAFILAGGTEHGPSIQMLAALGQVIGATHHAANPLAVLIEEDD